MKKFKIKSFCKVNLLLRVFKKRNTNYHPIKSLITFCNLYDLIYVQKISSSKDKIIFYGKFNNKIKRNSNTITRLLDFLRKRNFLKNQTFKISIKKNIPHGSGLGGGSSNAAALLNFFNKKMNMKLSQNMLVNIGRRIGFDVPIVLEKRNTILTGEKNEIIRLRKKLNLNVLIVYPNIICSTKKIYDKNIKFTTNKSKPKISIKDKNKLINYLVKEHNDLQDAVINIYPRIGNLINLIKIQKGCYFSRISGSGSACIGIFSDVKSAILTKKLIKRKFPNYWSVVSKSI